MNKGQQIDEITVALDWHDTLEESPRCSEVMAYAKYAGALPIATADGRIIVGRVVNGAVTR